MDTLSIRIKIGDREYPMKVKVADEARIRQAGKLLNEKIKQYRETFGLDDKQDLLAMVAFDCMVASMEQESLSTADREQLSTKLHAINEQLEGLL
ncbi:MAG: cell division protein ZapA [Nitritalea sp.]|nr:cell division protein ZapA [Nitritalea halalkaliphila]